jgi:hypothetical protein
MKKYILILCGALLFACNQSSNNKQTDEHAVHENGASPELTLNNGEKWKADSITNHNVVNLKTIADNFRIKPFPSINDYQILGNDLNNGLNKMLRECKMSGPDHDALHHWLEPVIKGTNELKSSADTSVGRLVFKSIDKQIDDYHNYFE